jgi:hypothetical protein
MISWTDAETDKLADAVAHARMKDPTASFIELVRTAVQTHLPDKRRREIKSVQMIPVLVQRVQHKLIEIKTDAGSVQSMKDQLAARKTADEVLSNLSDFEITQRFGGRVIALMTPATLVANFTTQQLLDGIPVADLAAEAMRRYVMEACGPRTQEYEIVKPPAQQVSPRRATKPHVLFVGLKPEQFSHVVEALNEIADCYYAAAGDKPAGKYDLVLLWTKFVSHSDENHAKTLVTMDKILRRSGGLTAMIDSVRSIVMSTFYS